MKSILAISIMTLGLVSLSGPLMFGQSSADASPEKQQFSGQLVDASCNPKPENKNCEASATTSQFGILVDGKVYAFDSVGNSKAQTEMKNNSKSGPVSVTVTGKLNGTMIQVESLKIA